MNKQFINLDMFENNEPKQEWFNQLNVYIAMGILFEQKGNFQKAADLYASVLIYDPKDTKTRVRLIKCYRKLLQPEKAEIHLNYMMQSDPHLFLTLQNEGNVNLELEKFECSLMMHNQLLNKIQTSQNCNQELANVIIQKNIMIKSLWVPIVYNKLICHINYNNTYNFKFKTIKT